MLIAGEAVETVDGLKKFLADNVVELRGLANTSYKDGGINVEGIAWDAKGGRLLLGLRSPVVDGHALVVPLKQDPQGLFLKTSQQGSEILPSSFSTPAAMSQWTRRARCPSYSGSFAGYPSLWSC